MKCFVLCPLLSKHGICMAVHRPAIMMRACPMTRIRRGVFKLDTGRRCDSG